MKYVKVQFQKHNQVYTYFVPEGDDPKVGDRVITSLSTGLSFEQGYPIEFKMATVINVMTEDDGKATKFYTALLSMDVLKARHEANKDYKKRAEEKRAIKAQLDEMLKARLDIERYAMLANTEDGAALLARLKELG